MWGRWFGLVVTFVDENCAVVEKIIVWGEVGVFLRHQREAKSVFIIEVQQRQGAAARCRPYAWTTVWRQQFDSYSETKSPAVRILPRGFL